MVPDLCEDLLSAVDQPLKVAKDKIVRDQLDHQLNCALDMIRRLPPHQVILTPTLSGFEILNDDSLINFDWLVSKRF